MPYFKKALYQANQTTPYAISRSKIELFTQCPRCFWLEARKGIKRPSSPPFQINKAIDELFKNEFDQFRAKQERHPIMVENNLDLLPYRSDQLDTWRDSFKGVRSLHKTTNLEIFGGVDDIWVNNSEELVVVDYKATAKNKEVSLDADWQKSYKRQLEVYQWLLRQLGYQVSNTGYFVYTNAIFNKGGFGNELKFKTKLIAHDGNDSWVEPTLLAIKETLDGDIPSVGESIMGGACEHCSYARQRTELTFEYIKTNSRRS